MFGRVIAKFRGTNRKAETPSSNVLSRVLGVIFTCWPDFAIVLDVHKRNLSDLTCVIPILIYTP